MTHTIRVFLCTTLLISGLTILSATQAAPAAAQVCAGCHGPQGQGAGVFPRIAGQPIVYLEKELQFYRSGARPNPMMQAVAAKLSDEEIGALAEYFSKLHPPYVPSAGTLSAPQTARARQLVTAGDWRHGVPACVRCHGPDLAGVAPQIPALAGQPSQYLLATLQLIHDMRAPHYFPLRIMSRVSKGLSETDINAVSGYIAQLKPGEKPQAGRPLHDAAYKFTAQSTENFTPPPETAIPTGPDGDMIWRGRLIFENTRQYAHAYVGNALNCANCHLDRGRLADSAPMWAAYVVYPKYRSKNHKVNTLEERIQDCFRFSMNGRPPPADSPEMVALVDYFHWLATGLPVGITSKGAGYPKLPAPPAPPSIERGAAAYAANCAMCHGDLGEGREARGVRVFPPLWGARSFNWGAGMQGISTAAEFIKANMPYGAGGTLSDQQAWDVAAFVVSHPRPQDPRFTGSVRETRAKYHRKNSYYGRVVNGKLLGAPENSAHPHNR
jgi:thiosulfate dehydrogenase